MRALVVVVLASCTTGPHTVTVSVATDTPVAETSARFLSVAVDTAEVVGGKFWDPNGSSTDTPVAVYDFTRPQLRALAAALAPAYLRIGGTDADRTHIDLSPQPVTTPPANFEWVLTRAEWDGVVDFANALDYQIMFTINAGAGPRNASNAWQPDDVSPLVQLVASRQDPVALWELGNEVNVYPLVLGLTVAAQQWDADVATARALLDQVLPGAKLAGPASAYWPKVGEVIAYLPAALAGLAGSGASVDVVTWHYYPQQSQRCPVAVRPAGPDVMLDPSNLDDVQQWIGAVTASARASTGSAQIWLGETGNAQCGGQPGVSDAFAGSLWWLDELGTMARAGQPVVVRQTLSGSNYGLIDDMTLVPNPDYWASLLWRRLVGTKVLAVTVPESSPLVRVYAQCSAGGGGATLLAINLSQTETITVRAPALDGTSSQRYRVTAASLGARAVSLEGTMLEAAADGTPPAFTSASGDGSAQVELPPLSYAFVVISGAAPSVCD